MIRAEKVELLEERVRVLKGSIEMLQKRFQELTAAVKACESHLGAIVELATEKEEAE